MLPPGPTTRIISLISASAAAFCQSLPWRRADPAGRIYLTLVAGFPSSPAYGRRSLASADGRNRRDNGEPAVTLIAVNTSARRLIIRDLHFWPVSNLVQPRSGACTSTNTNSCPKTAALWQYRLRCTQNLTVSSGLTSFQFVDRLVRHAWKTT